MVHLVSNRRICNRRCAVFTQPKRGIPRVIAQAGNLWLKRKLISPRLIHNKSGIVRHRVMVNTTALPPVKVPQNT